MAVIQCYVWIKELQIRLVVIIVKRNEIIFASSFKRSSAVVVVIIDIRHLFANVSALI